jgi:hypothetical protein
MLLDQNLTAKVGNIGVASQASKLVKELCVAGPKKRGHNRSARYSSHRSTLQETLVYIDADMQLHGLCKRPLCILIQVCNLHGHCKSS